MSQTSKEHVATINKCHFLKVKYSSCKPTTAVHGQQAKKERLEDWTAVLSDASRHAEALALAFEDVGARTGDTGMALIRLGRFQVQRNQEMPRALLSFHWDCQTSGNTARMCLLGVICAPCAHHCRALCQHGQSRSALAA
jgi:hypothetical protein